MQVVKWNSRGDDPFPENAVPIGRNTKYGNPHTVQKVGREMALRLYEQHARDEIRKNIHWLDDLRGRNLVCPGNCKPKPCHGDILIKLCEETDETTSPPG